MASGPCRSRFQTGSLRSCPSNPTRDPLSPMLEPSASTPDWTRIRWWPVWSVASCWLLLAYGVSLAVGTSSNVIVLCALALGVAGVVASALALSAEGGPLVRCAKFVGLLLLSVASAAVEALAVGFIDIAVTGLAG